MHKKGAGSEEAVARRRFAIFCAPACCEREHTMQSERVFERRCEAAGEEKQKMHS